MSLTASMTMILLIQIIFWGVIVVGIIRHIKAKQYTWQDYQKGLKVVGLGLVIILLMCIGGNSNQNPNSFIERILRPIMIGNGSFHYAGFIVVAGMYFVLKKIYKMLSIKWLDETWKRLLAIIAIMYLLAPLQVDLVKLYRSWQPGVDSIYLYRDQMEIKTNREGEGDELVVTLEGRISIENLAPISRQFGMKVEVPSYMQDLVGSEWIEVHPTYDEQYEIGAKTKDTLEFEVVIHRNKKELEEKLGKEARALSVGGGRTSVFEVVLYDGETEAYFERDYFDKYISEREKERD